MEDASGSADPADDLDAALLRDLADVEVFSDEEIHCVHELPHWKDLDNLHHKVSYHLSTKLVAKKPVA